MKEDKKWATDHVTGTRVARMLDMKIDHSVHRERYQDTPVGGNEMHTIFVLLLEFTEMMHRQHGPCLLNNTLKIKGTLFINYQYRYFIHEYQIMQCGFKRTLNLLYSTVIILFGCSSRLQIQVYCLCKVLGC